MDDPDFDRLQKGGQQLSVSQELDNMLSEAKIDTELVQSLGEGMRKLSDTAGALNETVDAAAATQEYSAQLGSAAKNMESLNALYAVQLENTNAQVNMQSNIMEKLGATAEDSEKLADEITRLTSNIGSLNTVYGNMLSAMNFSK
jgi:gliding motility-associated protein GldL